MLLEYTLDAPELRRQGVVPTQYGPPTAVKMAMEKFWSTLTSRLKAMNVSEPRRKTADERRFLTFTFCLFHLCFCFTPFFGWYE